MPLMVKLLVQSHEVGSEARGEEEQTWAGLSSHNAQASQL